MKITYQVQIDVQKDIEAEWLSWISEKHIPDVCEVAKVSDALLIKYDDNSIEGHANYRILYIFETKEDLDSYTNTDMARLRVEHEEKFLSKISVTRRYGVLLKWYERT